VSTPPQPGKGKKVSWKWWAVGGGIAVLAGLGWYLYKRNSSSSSTAAGTACTDANGNPGTTDANGNCISTSTASASGTDDSGTLSAIQSELEGLQQEESAEGTTTTTPPPPAAGTVKVPAVEGLGIAPAEAKIKAAGLVPKLNTKTVGGTSYIIKSQTPGAGKDVAKGSTVDLAAEKKPVPVKVVGRK